MFPAQGINVLRFLPYLRSFVRCVSYVQGQSPSPKTREYFYYIDHQGQVHVDIAQHIFARKQ